MGQMTGMKSNSGLPIKTQFPLTQQSVGTSESSLLAVLVGQAKLTETRQGIFDRMLTDAVLLEEQLKMNDCYYDKKDWRACKKEVSRWFPNPKRSFRGHPMLMSNYRWKFSENAGSGMPMI